MDVQISPLWTEAYGNSWRNVLHMYKLCKVMLSWHLAADLKPSIIHPFWQATSEMFKLL
jgi:hypothetical protein